MQKLILVFLVLATGHVDANEQPRKYTHNVKAKFFTDVELHCDHNELNITNRIKDVTSLTWIFPDGSLVDSKTNLNHRKYQLSGIPEVPPSGTDFMGYTLKAFEIDDDVFGYYTCIVVFNQTAQQNGDNVVAIRLGLNVNGADFSELIDEYKENAIIGGIAAAVTLVVITGACLTWYFCFREEMDTSSEDKNVGGDKNGIEMHENIGYINEKDMHGGASARKVVDPEEIDASTMH